MPPGRSDSPRPVMTAEARLAPNRRSVASQDPHAHAAVCASAVSRRSMVAGPAGTCCGVWLPRPRCAGHPVPRTLPRLRRMKSNVSRIVVVLPAPFVLRYPKTSPASTVRVRSSSLPAARAVEPREAVGLSGDLCVLSSHRRRGRRCARVNGNVPDNFPSLPPGVRQGEPPGWLAVATRRDRALVVHLGCRRATVAGGCAWTCSGGAVIGEQR